MSSNHLSKEHCLNIYKEVKKSRLVDKKMQIQVRQNKGTTFFLSTAGHELIGAIASSEMIPGKDWALPYYRDRAFVIGLGEKLEEIFGAFLARDVSHHSSGRMMLDHFSNKSLHLPCQSSCVGSQFLQAVGVALGIKLRKEKEIVYVSAGDGATSQGDFHEALNFSCIHRLPILFVIQDNGWAISVPSHEQTTGGSIFPIAKGYPHLTSYEVDGTDYEKMSKTFSLATKKLREQEGPCLIVCKVPRLGPHTSSDDPKKYKNEKTIQEEKKKDPLVLLEKYILQKQYLSKEELNKIEKELKDEVEKAATYAEDLPFPKDETATTKIFKDFIVPPSKKPKVPGEKIVIMDALNRALVEEMRKDPSVIVFGEDVAHGKGGVFGITRKLTEEFGENRCFNTPLAESTIIGISIGLSMVGFKPVIEIQFADYVWTGMNQLVNELSSIYYRSNGEWNCPVVVRLPFGGYIQGGPYHSQSLEGFLTHVPGLKIVVPSNAYDAKRLLKTAILDPNPVIFLEHKALYRQKVFCEKQESGEDEYLAFGKAKIVHTGSDITLLCYGMMVMMAYEIATKLEKEGISVEVIDLRTLVPLDEKTIFSSLKKTNKLLIVHEDTKTCGFGAEIATLVMEKAFSDLDAPIVRVTAKDAPIPYGKNLENQILPQKDDVEKAIRKLAQY